MPERIATYLAGIELALDASNRITASAEREWHVCRDVSEHAERVASVSRALGADLGLDGKQLEYLFFAARMHDVGKFLLDQVTLHKSGGLDDAERAHIQTHAKLGADLLATVPGLPVEVIEVARFHHERYDGHGYEGLVGEAIPYITRIVQIADVHDALRSTREYKSAMEEGEVLSKMAADEPSPGFGRRAFDPVLLRRFVAMRIAVNVEIDHETRSALQAFALSDPSLDLAPGDLSVEFHDNGDRTVYSRNGADRVASMTIDLTGAPIEPELAVAYR